MVIIFSDTDTSCQLLEFLLYLIRENSFMSWNVVLSIMLDVYPLHRFVLIPTWLVLLQINLLITIMIIMTMSYEGTLAYF